MSNQKPVPPITVNDVVKLYRCKANEDCLHDELQWKQCMSCNPQLVTRSEWEARNGIHGL